MRRAAAAALVAALALLGCSDDGGDESAGNTTATLGTTDETAPEDCLDTAAADAPDQARAAFADSPDATWTVLGARDGGLGMVLVELEPDEAILGYPSFTFVFGCAAGSPEHLATYALEGDEYRLLIALPADEDIEFAPVLEE